MFKRNKVEVVPVEKYTDYSERFEEFEKIRQESKYATRKDILIMGAIPTVAAVGLAAYNKMTTVEPSTISEVVPVMAQSTNSIPGLTGLPDTFSSLPANAPVQTGVIADKSLEMLATILDPVVQILVAISFPIASVIMIGACFFFMIGNPEKAWGMIMNAGLGYVLIQISPLFLDILRTVGEAI